MPIAEVKKDYEEWLIKSEYKTGVNVENHDTIGMLALDASGRMAGACTTSGMAYKIRGRVGDSPIIGAGLFIDGDVGGATATGVGEAMIRTAGCASVVESMRRGALAGGSVLRYCTAHIEKASRCKRNAGGIPGDEYARGIRRI